MGVSKDLLERLRKNGYYGQDKQESSLETPFKTTHLIVDDEQEQNCQTGN